MGTKFEGGWITQWEWFLLDTLSLDGSQGCTSYGSYGVALKELFFLKLGYINFELRADTIER